MSKSKAIYLRVSSTKQDTASQEPDLNAWERSQVGVEVLRFRRDTTGTHGIHNGDTHVFQGYLLNWKGESRNVGFDDPAGEMWRAWRWLGWQEWRRSRQMKLLRSM